MTILNRDAIRYKMTMHEFKCRYANTANATFVSVFSKEHNPSIILLGKRPIYATLASVWWLEIVKILVPIKVIYYLLIYMFFG